MINLSRIEDYRENNRIEAKKALGGLPESIWETYSSFSNTLGGIILLGVEEHKDRTLHPIELPDPQALVDKFRRILADRRYVSCDVLGDDGVKTELAEGKRIVVITVPRAPRRLRPVYIGGDPFNGTYRRSGEGDYRCTKEEVSAMLRDAQGISYDSALTDLPLSSLDKKCVQAYREMVGDGEIKSLPHEDFLRAVGAAAQSGEGVKPTVAGLLMFGKNADICGIFPHYFLEYRSERAENASCAVQTGFIISSDSGLKCGNVFEFYLAVRERLVSGADGEVAAAMCEALANCLCNADYHGRKGVIILKKSGGAVFSNPGIFPADVAAAEGGELSDPRNRLISRIFVLAGLKQGRGGGIAGIYALWNRRGWARPSIRESFAPERTTFTLTFSPQKAGRTRGRARPSGKLAADIITFLTDNIRADIPEIAAGLGVKQSEVKECVRALASRGVIVADGGGYRLKS